MIDRFRGAILGFAIGDALGMPVEGMSRDEIADRYGVVESFIPSPYRDLDSGEWTDDTEQMIALAESILKTVYFCPEDFAERLKLIKSHRIGPTTRAALKNLTFGVHWSKAGMVSETCGSSVRVLPIGLVYSFSLDLVENYAFLSSVVTHKGSAVGGAVAVAVAVACILRGFSEREMLEEVVGRTEKYDDLIAEKIDVAYEISDKNLDYAIERLGNSMSVYESVPFAFYCYFSSSNFKDCALKAVNAGGDADSIAAIACGMKGCELGVESIPDDWISGLRDRELLLDLADRLHDLHITISTIG